MGAVTFAAIVGASTFGGVRLLLSSSVVERSPFDASNGFNCSLRGLLALLAAARLV